MKKLVLLFIAVFVFSFASAQKNVVKVNPLGLLFGSTQLSYEYVLSDAGAVELSLAYSSSKVNFGETKVTATGFGAEGKYKFYFSSGKEAPRGWYVAPLVAYSSITGKSDESKGTVSSFSGGVVGGYQWIFGGGDSGFALDLNFGAQYKSASTSGDITAVSLEGFLPRVGLSLGYAF